MYNNPYMTNLNLNDRIDSEIERLKQMKAQVQQPVQPITQNFQLAPTSGIKYANTLEEVKKEIVYTDTPFFSKDFSIMWLKSAKGEVKNYELKEIIEKDEKYLIARRSTGSEDVLGKWEFPGGKVEKDESEEHAIEREI